MVAGETPGEEMAELELGTAAPATVGESRDAAAEAVSLGASEAAVLSIGTDVAGPGAASAAKAPSDPIKRSEGLLSGLSMDLSA